MGLTLLCKLADNGVFKEETDSKAAAIILNSEIRACDALRSLMKISIYEGNLGCSGE